MGFWGFGVLVDIPSNPALAASVVVLMFDFLFVGLVVVW